MASIQFIQTRIAGKEKEIEKLDKKLARIKKAQATDWQENPYYYTEYDLKATQRELESAKKALDDYRQQLQKAIEKEESRNVKAILDFLENWKTHMRHFFIEKMFPEYLKARQALQEQNLAYTEWFNKGGYREAESKEKRNENRKLNQEFEATWNFISPYIIMKYDSKTGRRSPLFDKEKFEKDILQEANRKYDDIIARTNALIGKILDASFLTIGEKGDLNGIIIGENGKANVNTIGAGGYNIQCYHFRTLIHKIS